MTNPLVTVVVPSFNQAQYLEQALKSLTDQDVPLEIFVMDGGSTDGSVGILQRYAPHLASWRSHKDDGQSAAINEGIALGSAPFVAWLNSDDLLLPGGLHRLIDALEAAPSAPAAYGRAWNHNEANGRRTPVWVEPFELRRLAQRCIVSQPATLIRRSAWQRVGGLDISLRMAMDYDLWWRLYHASGPLAFVPDYVAVNRDHPGTKTNTYRSQHYREAIAVVRRHAGRVPLKWWLLQPYAVWYKALRGMR
ncbi:glycosyltransferase family 2 protein [Tardiphaga sp. 813_E8_N1_3]|uniref:glycosyltransferase family 2 protein n=1 Tax=Tardiphaga sp. 813_E8_N1_3 TaxID=3240760 RepID=UPI003F227998